MISCSNFKEQEEILDYKEYINQAWNAFETVNLDELIQDSTNTYYYQLSLDLFNASIQAIDYEFTNQNLEGPFYESYNGIGWTQLYYASEFLDPSIHHVRDSLREQSKIYFNLADQNLNLHSSLSRPIDSQDKMDIYLGLAYTYYYLGLQNSDYSSDSLSLDYSDKLLSINSSYNFYHDEIDYRNIHYLKGKIYLKREDYNQACQEMIEINGCDCFIDSDVNLDILFDCFNEFANGI